jgi:glycosyltransferase involved in cell wall biosynthesis
MEKLINDEELRKSMSERGLERVKDFYAPKIVEKSVALYKELLNLN